jgi:hypothetical protein
MTTSEICRSCSSAIDARLAAAFTYVYRRIREANIVGKATWRDTEVWLTVLSGRFARVLRTNRVGRVSPVELV